MGLGDGFFDCSIVSDPRGLANIVGGFPERNLNWLVARGTLWGGWRSNLELKTPTIAKNLRNHTSKILPKHPQDAIGDKP